MNWNNLVLPDDTVYILGDLMLNDNEHGLRCLNRLMGHKIIVLGNHDTDKRIGLYSSNGFEVIGYSTVLKYNNYHFYLSHFPTLTGNFENENLKQMFINLYGHTHQKTNFYKDRPYMYHVGVDSHKCAPVALEQIIVDINKQVEKCKSYL